MYPLSPITLRFRNPARERDFARECSQQRRGDEVIGCLVLMFIGCVPWLGGKFPEVILKHVCCHLGGPCAVYHSARWTDASAMRRNLGVFTSAWSSAVHMAIYRPGIPDPAPRVGSFLAGAFYSPFVPLVFHHCVIPLPFRVHVLLDMSLFWMVCLHARNYCALCDASESDFTHVVNSLESLEGLSVSMLAPNWVGLPTVRSPKDCFSVVIFGQTLLGIILPLFVMYRMELTNRILFLTRYMNGQEGAKLQKLKDRCFWWSLFALHIAVMVLWVVF